jgi:hypothetical protein
MQDPGVVSINVGSMMPQGSTFEFLSSRDEIYFNFTANNGMNPLFPSPIGGQNEPYSPANPQVKPTQANVFGDFASSAPIPAPIMQMGLSYGQQMVGRGTGFVTEQVIFGLE